MFPAFLSGTINTKAMTKSKYPPILFNTEMVQAILDNRKKQTRRLIKDPYVQERLESGDHDRTYIEKNVPYKIGDILWVRETWHEIHDSETNQFIKYGYKADWSEGITSHPKNKGIWKPSIHMPKEATRIFLKVTKVKWERIQDISEADAIAEGVELFDTNRYKDYEDLNNSFLHARISFASLWESINGKNSWQKNPYVWVYDFEQVEKPSDFLS